jgi:hypothetical protein
MFVPVIRISLNTMTLQIQSEHVYTQLGVAISVTGIAQVCHCLPVVDFSGASLFDDTDLSRRLVALLNVIYFID